MDVIILVVSSSLAQKSVQKQGAHSIILLTGLYNPLMLTSVHQVISFRSHLASAIFGFTIAKTYFKMIILMLAVIAGPVHYEDIDV